MPAFDKYEHVEWRSAHGRRYAGYVLRLIRPRAATHEQGYTVLVTEEDGEALAGGYCAYRGECELEPART